MQKQNGDRERQPANAGKRGHISLQRGQIVAGRYTVLDMIGRGGMGAIYKVYDNTLREEVALKTLLPQFAQDRIVVERFYNEARIARQLSHPNIIRVHDIGLAGNILYISMEFLEGRSLRSILDSLPPGQRLPIKTTLRIIDELCASLEYAHQYTVHRDIKPENVMVGRDGSVKLMDFGISKLMAPNKMTKTSVIMGTPHYMSPEQLKDSGRVDARADIYSVGVMLYEILSGHLPTGMIRSVTQLNEDLPATLDGIIARCTEPDPLNRFSTVRELREALRPIREVIEAGSAASVPIMPPPPSAVPGAVRKALGIVLSVLIAIAAGAALWKLEERRRESVAVASESPGAVGAVQAMERLTELANRALRLAESQPVDERANDAIEAGRSLWAEAQRLAEEGNNAEALQQGWGALHCFLAPLILPEGMVFIPPGEVELRDANGTGGSVSLGAFFIDEHEVTVAEFDEFRRAENWVFRFPLPRGNLPVTNVTFYDAKAYAAWRGRRLPTEAQWARAAYDVDGAPLLFPWGAEPGEEEFSGPRSPGVPGVLAPPGTFPDDRTPFGCFDMAGNVAEWTRSEFRPLPYRTEDGREDLEDTAFGKLIVVRGGHFARVFPLTVRNSHVFEGVSPQIGFRCVQELPTSFAAVEEILAGR